MTVATRTAHTPHDLVAQRLYGLCCCGHEDLNDHDRLRHDPLLQTSVGKADELASSLPSRGTSWRRIRIQLMHRLDLPQHFRR